jgi:hypothetical protein
MKKILYKDYLNNNNRYVDFVNLANDIYNILVHNEQVELSFKHDSCFDETGIKLIFVHLLRLTTINKIVGNLYISESRNDINEWMWHGFRWAKEDEKGSWRLPKRMSGNGWIKPTDDISKFWISHEEDKI